MESTAVDAQTPTTASANISLLKMSAKGVSTASGEALPLAGSLGGKQNIFFDINSSAALLDGQSLLDIEIDGFEEKPWRKPGADLTDYFNFGFNEITWKQYCYKQKTIRDEFTGGLKQPLLQKTQASTQRQTGREEMATNSPSCQERGIYQQQEDSSYRHRSRSREPQREHKRSRPDDQQQQDSSNRYHRKRY